MFQYTVPTAKQESNHARVRERNNKLVAKGLKTIHIEECMKMATLRQRILQEGKAYTKHLPCPVLTVCMSDDGPYVRIMQTTAVRAQWAAQMWPDHNKPATLIPLADYWKIILGPHGNTTAP